MGVVERDRVLTGKAVEVGDILLGLPSTGLHTNGYSLARKLLFSRAGYSPETYVNEIKGKVGNELMKQHRSYWPLLRRLLEGDNHQRHGPHHRRRHHGEPAARAAQGHRRHGRTGDLAGAAHLRAPAEARQHRSRPR